MIKKTKLYNDKKYKYKVETHMHTNQGSACAISTGAELARAYKRNGYCAIIITDHFFNGNTAVRGGHYSWEDKIALFMKGYEDAKSEGDKIGLGVYFGFELADNGSEFLVYNYGRDKLTEYPGIVTDNIEKSLTRIKREGGFIVHAHPFRDEYYIKNPGKLFPDYADAVEVINAHNKTNEMNRRALEYAEKYNLIKFSGSDAHSASPQEGGLAFKNRPESLEDILETAAKGGEEYVMLGEEYLL